MLACASLLLSPATGAGTALAAPQDGAPLVIYHWWNSPSEIGALDALTRAVKTKYPGFTDKRMTTPDRNTSLFTVMQNLYGAGKPADVVVMHTGYAMKPFVDAGLLARLDDLWISERLEKLVPLAVQSMMQFEGHFYSAPLDLHRTNLVWYNRALLDKHGIDPATLTTKERFFEAASRLRAAGVTHPIQIAADWTVVIVFENLLASQGLGVYQEWVNGRIRSASDPRLLRALEELKQYVSFANRDHAGLDWLVALRRVASGESAFYSMGDWANGDFRAAGLGYGKDYGALVAPGTSGLYAVALDSVAKPLGLAQAESANRWLRVAASRDGQDAFNVLKGSISARSDSVVGRYDAYQKSAIASFRQSKPFPTTGAAMPAGFVRAMNATLEAFVDDGNVQRAAASLAASATGTATAFTRTWTPQ